MLGILADSLMVATRQKHVMVRDAMIPPDEQPRRHNFWRRQSWRIIDPGKL